jgi:hypothetical protein
MGAEKMTEPDALIIEIDTLKAAQREAWRELASPALTTFDRREIRNRIRQSEVELRASLQLMSERLAALPAAAAGRDRRQPRKPQFSVL